MNASQQKKTLRAAQIEQAVMLVQRLERLSADSTWAHLASGIRGAILRCISRLESGGESSDTAERARLQALTLKGFELLERAALELTAFSSLAEPKTDSSGSQDAF
ncbi:MAG: hypothetical protein HPY59_00050 [Anaerolineae bacterium]|nr:hypothetical protein [Anaerolineae bacterium]